MKTKVTLRKRAKGDMYHYYLDFYPPYFNPKTRTTQRQKVLDIKTYIEPKDAEQRRYNEHNEALVNAIYHRKVLELESENYGVFNEEAFNDSFIDYYRHYAETKTNTKAMAAFLQFEKYVHGKCRFSDITDDLILGFKDYLLNEAVQSRRGTPLHHNTAAAYSVQLMCVLKQAYRERRVKEKFGDFVDPIPAKATHRPYLTMDEARRLLATPCRYDVLKRASFFSILTGLRISDIMDLKWEDIQTAPDGGPCIRKVIQKTQEQKLIYVNNEALSYCGQPYRTGPVFCGLKKSMTHEPLKKWLKDAGIEKNFSFHCFRHTFATLQLLGGTDIYTVSHQLTHAFITTTQIYVDLVDEKGRQSANAISFLPENTVDEQ